MTCRGAIGDYICPGWVARAATIRTRDGNRCRGCNRSADEVRIEVHHRIYGSSGPCGQCYLTAVTDEDLTTLCGDCHDALTNIRRHLRYASRSIVVDPLPDANAVQTAISLKSELIVEILSLPSSCGVVVKRNIANF